MRKTIAGHMLDILEERKATVIHAGTTDLLEECSSRVSDFTNLMHLPASKRHQRILNALEKSPLFTKTYIRRDRKRALKRCFIAT